ncbi:MAG: sigma-70 family RNA polymerase sigma factor [Xanthomonadales bacterium]|nr:sigma-70 family RNA polymerase sigma factor [Xanthomonadales bacterium]
MPIYLEDRKLVKRLLAGEERAFNAFFDENFSRLYRFALTRMRGDPEATREIVQSALTKALKNIRKYRGEAALFTWLCVICRNEVVDWARRNKRYHETIVLTEDEPDIRQVVESLDAPGSDQPGALYQRHEATRLIQVALDRLPPRYGDALEWMYIEGHSVKEIARRLDLSPEAAQSLLARAKLAFRDIYSTLAQPVLDNIEAQKT